MSNGASRESHDAIIVYLFIVWLQFPEDTVFIYYKAYFP